MYFGWSDYSSVFFELQSDSQANGAWHFLDKILDSSYFQAVGWASGFFSFSFLLLFKYLEFSMFPFCTKGKRSSQKLTNTKWEIVKRHANVIVDNTSDIIYPRQNHVKLRCKYLFCTREICFPLVTREIYSTRLLKWGLWWMNFMSRDSMKNMLRVIQLSINDLGCTLISNDVCSKQHRCVNWLRVIFCTFFFYFLVGFFFFNTELISFLLYKSVFNLELYRRLDETRGFSTRLSNFFFYFGERTPCRTILGRITPLHPYRSDWLSNLGLLLFLSLEAKQRRPTMVL